MRSSEDTLVGTCGVGVLYNFAVGGWGTPLGEATDSGCGWYVAGFVDTDTCKQAYEELCEKYTLVYQSPVRLNINSGNDFFFCIFDAGQPEEEEVDDEGYAF